MATIPTEKLNELMMKVRKGATSSFTLAQIQAIVEALGGSFESFTGLVKGVRSSGRNMIWADSETEAETYLSVLRKAPAPGGKLKPGVMYVSKIDDVAPQPGGFRIFFDSFTAAIGVKIELGGKSAELLPSEYSIQEARDYVHQGPRKESVRASEVVGWLAKNTDWVARANAFLNMEEHVPAEARTRDRTGSCPVCFQNVKLASEKIVLHGYKRPGHGTVQGKCIGVGFPPFELSVKGTKEFLDEYLEPGLRSLKESRKALDAEDLTTVKPYNREYTRNDPEWDMMLRRAKEDLDARVKSAERERDAYERLVRNWKERPLPKEGERHIDWFTAGQKSASTILNVRIARVHFLKTAFDTKKWGPFVFEIDRPKGFKKEWTLPDGSVKKYTYPVDYGYFVGHTGEDEEGLDAFVGSDPEGKIECFLKLKPAENGEGLVPDETKFLVGLSDEERKKVMALYKPEEVTNLREFEDVYELLETLGEFRDRTASVRVAARFLQAASDDNQAAIDAGFWIAKDGGGTWAVSFP